VGKELEDLWIWLSLVAVVGSQKTNIIEADGIGILRMAIQRENENENEEGK
jgi:hypothetical protein